MNIVYRGGKWNNHPYVLYITYRKNSKPHQVFVNKGFRLKLTK